MHGTITTVNPVMEITPHLFEVQECRKIDSFTKEWGENPPSWMNIEPGDEVHNTTSCYLLKDEKTLLSDTCSPAVGDAVLEGVKEALDGQSLDYLVVSHGEAPHAGNTGRILREFPDATLIVGDHTSPEHEMFRMEDATLVDPGDQIDLGRLQVEIVEGIFPDTAMTIWLYEHEMEALFTVDWMGNQHSDPECGKTLRQLEPPSEITPHRLYEFHARVLPWMAYADPERLTGMVDYLLERYDPEMIVPSHGFVIEEDANRYLEMMKQAMERITEDGAQAFHYSDGTN